jgi:predicted dehydrogenase
MTLRILLAGLGVRGRHWAQVITQSPRCEIAAYVDPNHTAREYAAAQFGARPAFESVEAALDVLNSIDALVLANPPIGREAQVRAAVAQNLPMLIEKPLALSVVEAAYLTQIAEAASVPMMVGLNFRYLGVTQATIQLLREERVGRAEFARFTYERYRDGHRPDLNKYPLTMAHPMLWEQSIHHFDLMRFVYGTEPVSIMCRTWNPGWSMYASDTNVAALITFANGMTVNYQGTWQSGWAEPRFEWRTDCTQGVLFQHHQFGELSFAEKFATTTTPVSLPPHEQWITETAGLLDAFLRGIVDGQPLECSARDHLTSLAMVEACIRSNDENRSVSIAEVLDEVRADTR